MKPESARVIADLKELRALTSDEGGGAQRVAWGPTWRKARQWYEDKLTRDVGLKTTRDGAGNLWTTLPATMPVVVGAKSGGAKNGGAKNGDAKNGDANDGAGGRAGARAGAGTRSLVMGSHIDSVPSGGWLDGVLGVVAGIEVLRRLKARGGPPVDVHLVDWADEEGARFGRSLTGSAASAGALDAHKELAHLVDREGKRLPDALAENGVTLDGMATAHAYFRAHNPAAYLELHIEQGPVLESMKKPCAVVLGTMGVERHMLRFVGQAAHSGAAPIHLRKDAFLAASEFALACRAISVAHSGRSPRSRVVATCGVVKVEPNFVTAVPGSTDISIDLRALDGKVLRAMLKEAQRASRVAAKQHLVSVTWSPLLHITPRPFDETLMRFVGDAIKGVTGKVPPQIPSGPLHDASEMAAVVPTAMVFAMSSPGVSHTRIEDTPLPALDKSIRAFLVAVDRTLDHLASRT